MIEETLAALTAALKENTAVLREVLAAGGDTKVVHTITPAAETPKPAKKKAEKVEPVKEEPAAAVVEPAPEPETTGFVDVPDSDPAPDTTLDPEALIVQITDAWKAQLSAADPARKAMLKDKFPELRAKWGLAADAKLITLAPNPEKLVGLLADIKDL